MKAKKCQKPSKPIQDLLIKPAPHLAQAQYHHQVRNLIQQSLGEMDDGR